MPAVRIKRLQITDLAKDLSSVLIFSKTPFLVSLIFLYCLSVLYFITSTLILIISFFLPLFGLVFFFVWFIKVKVFVINMRSFFHS